MGRGERLRVILCFGLLGVASVLIMGRLFQLQALHRSSYRKSLHLQAHRFEAQPLARGSIVDRNDRPLAEDRPVIEVRVEAVAKVPNGHPKRLPASFVDALAGRLAAHLASDPMANPRRSSGLRTRLIKRLRARKVRRTKEGHLRVEFLLSGAVESLAVIERLRGEQRAWNQRGSELPGRIYLTFTKRFKRSYPERGITHGLVGQHGLQLVDGKSGRKQRREIATGMEALAGLWPDRMAPDEVPDWYPLGFNVDRKTSGFLRRRLTTPRRGSFWTGSNVEPPKPGVVKTTLDRRLQRFAHDELVKACADVQEHYKTPAGWGALVLVSVPDGDVLALASLYPAVDGEAAGATSFTPSQNLHEPGSVVKPLLFALALQRGVLDWNEEIDCTPNHGNLGWRVPGAPRRIIKDDHRCGRLVPHGVILNSSNIGAVQVGLRLGREGLQAYLDSYAFGTKTDLGLPYEAVGGQPKAGRLDKISDKQLQRFTGPSLSFGYEVQVTPIQLARAYLRLLTGEKRELRMFLSFARHGGGAARRFRRPRPERFLDAAVVEKIRGAMTAVVSDAEGATGRHLYGVLEKMGFSGSVIAGKTGTSVSPQKRPPTVMKTASFVGCAPAGSPRYLVVCVLQKERATRFYGGRYAAPAAGRLLLHCLEQERRDIVTRSSIGSGVGSLPSVRASGRGTQKQGVRSHKGRSND